MSPPLSHDPATDPHNPPLVARRALVDLDCDRCGAPLRWEPVRAALLCEHCGNQRTVEQREGTIEERPIEEAGQAARGLGLATRTLECGTCGARVALGATATSESCAFCGSASLLSIADSRNPLAPESLIPLELGQEQVEQRFRGWLRGLWFRPSALKRAGIGGANGLYVPAWTFDCHVHSAWNAEAGHYYYVTKSYTVRVNGRSETRTRRVRRTRWVPARGRRSDRFDDLQVIASHGLAPTVVARLGAYDTRELVPYQAEYLAGWYAEEYQIDLLQGWDQAHDEVVAIQRERCSRDVPGDTQRGLRVQNQIEEVRWKLALLPVWSLVYSFRGKSYAVLVNGQTGQVAGDAPYSWIKIMLCVLLVAAIVAGVAYGVEAGR